MALANQDTLQTKMKSAATVTSAAELVAYLAKEKAANTEVSFVNVRHEASEFCVGLVQTAKEATLVYFRYERSLTLPAGIEQALKQEWPELRLIDQGKIRKRNDNPDSNIVAGFTNPHYERTEVQAEVMRAVSDVLALQAKVSQTETKAPRRFGFFTGKKSESVAEKEVVAAPKNSFGGGKRN